MALTGFDPDVVNSSINAVKSAYEDLIKVLADDVQNQFVQGMADKWACNNAQTFFNNALKPAVDEIISGSNQTFTSVVSTMNDAGQNWASQTDSSYSPQSFSPIAKTIDTSVIRENIGGVRGVDLVAANTVADSLPRIFSAATAALTSAQSAVQSSGFVGGSMQANLVESLGVIKSKISEVVQNVTTQSKSAINQTVEQYANTEGRISQAFTIQG